MRDHDAFKLRPLFLTHTAIVMPLLASVAGLAGKEGGGGRIREKRVTSERNQPKTRMCF